LRCSAIVFLRVVVRPTLILLPLLTSAVRVNAHTVQTPIGVTQEVNRCLTVVRVAASRRRRTGSRATYDLHAAVTMRRSSSRRLEHGPPAAE
jgi:hypothetical protein